MPIEQNNNQNNQHKIDDIFSETETPSKPDVFQPKASESSAQIGEEQPAEKNIKKIAVLAGIILGLAILGCGGYWLYGKYGNKAAVKNSIVDETEKNGIGAAEDKNKNNAGQNKPAALPDKDQDGLSDEEESKLGTKSNTVDSDNDGLFDREEVKVYKTDPNKADTDGDGFSDGDEVKRGYNPNGSGTLYDLKK